MKKEGKFILLTAEEFKDWLGKQKIRRKVNLIQNHHTYSPNYNNFNGNNHFDLLRNMENYHVKQRSFIEIAQNITTFPDGTIAICRSFELAPAGIYGHNANAICIEHIGNFDIGGDTMTLKHKDSIVILNAELCRYFKLNPSKDTIVYHAWFNLTTGKRDNDNGKLKDANHKTCAGTNFFGGNSVQSAILNFYPLINKAMLSPTSNIIKKGDKGQNVKALQVLLIKLGYNLGKYGADGDFGANTEVAVKEFQKRYSLPQTGIVDYITWKTIAEKCAI